MLILRCGYLGRGCLGVLGISSAMHIQSVAVELGQLLVQVQKIIGGVRRLPQPAQL